MTTSRAVALVIIAVMRGVRAHISPRTVVLVRHGAVNRVAGGVPPNALYGGDIDVPLSLRGEAEARAAAAYVADRWQVSSVWASPLQRAVYGARCIADAAGVSDVAQLEAFREIRRGTWLRRTPDEIEGLTPGGMEAFLRDTAYRPPGGAESIDDVQRRALGALRDEILPALEPGRVAVLVSHLYVTRALLATALPGTSIPDIDVPTASIAALAFDDTFREATVLCRGIKPDLLAADLATVEAVAAFPKTQLLVYTGDAGVSSSAMRDKARSRFGVDIPSTLDLCYVKSRALVEPALYPVATLVCQSVGSMILALECVFRVPPDLLVDTTGFAFAYPVACLACGCATAAYVHYPTISDDMIAAVSSRATAFNNRRLWLTPLKLVYYRAFATAYGLAGRTASVVAANSSWTREHLQSLWRRPCRVVYPPCDAEHLCSLPARDKDLLVFSLAQFRPEKNHRLQLDAWASLPDDVRTKVTLVIAGAVRHEADEALLEDLRAESKRRDLNVRFLVGAPRPEIVAHMRKAAVGLHTMRLEHFGISVVEMMAARAVPVAHASGGPLLDIVGADQDRGFVAETAQEYAKAIAALVDDHSMRNRMADNARAFVQHRFSDAAFETAFLAALDPVLAPLQTAF
ncbi:hypothetical protein CTAYLR_001403 [Chrysophaeum taylorii]|uniref:GDP-Man:Man(3)GlcNAc(2)-PP-Dol alpha-1,2-mannosyltransferase n=1 Tax=Chrysophaeum taylorii TaxID=2483200 RepID=A0AAD7U9N9_9STRA|nr:hypothetical protein CTAYLR_001403 [Chrysophaeum taylorii]